MPKPNAFRVFQREHGVTSLEAAIVLPLLIVLVAGSTEWACLFYDSYLLEDGARSGARAAVVQRNVDAAAVASTIRSSLPDLELLKSANISVEGPRDFADDATSHLMMEVRLSNTHQFAFLGAIGVPPIIVERTVRMRYEWQVAGTTQSTSPGGGGGGGGGEVEPPIGQGEGEIDAPIAERGHGSRYTVDPSVVPQSGSESSAEEAVNTVEPRHEPAETHSAPGHGTHGNGREPAAG